MKNKPVKFYVALVILIVLVILILQNTGRVQVNLFWWHGEVRLIMLLLGIALGSATTTYLWMLKKN